MYSSPIAGGVYTSLNLSTFKFNSLILSFGSLSLNFLTLSSVGCGPQPLPPRHGHRAQPKGGENCCAIKCVSPPQAPSPFCATGQLYAVCLVLSLGTFYATFSASTLVSMMAMTARVAMTEMTAMAAMMELMAIMIIVRR